MGSGIFCRVLFNRLFPRVYAGALCHGFGLDISDCFVCLPGRPMHLRGLRPDGGGLADWQDRGGFAATCGQTGQTCFDFNSPGFALISLGTPAVSDRVFALWFSLPNIFILGWLPLAALALLGFIWQQFGRSSWPGFQGVADFYCRRLGHGAGLCWLSLFLFPPLSSQIRC